jgi:hypothetical protein
MEMLNLIPQTRVSLLTMTGTFVGFKHVNASAKNYIDGSKIDLGYDVAVIRWDDCDHDVTLREFDVLEAAV